MFMNFGWKSIVAITLGTLFYFVILKKDFVALRGAYKDLQFKQHIQHRFISKNELEKLYEDLEQNVDQREDRVPYWTIHIKRAFRQGYRSGSTFDVRFSTYADCGSHLPNFTITVRKAPKALSLFFLVLHLSFAVYEVGNLLIFFADVFINPFFHKVVEL